MGYSTSRNVFDGGDSAGSSTRLPGEDETVSSKPFSIFRGNLTSLLRDMARLADLQMQLLSFDMQQAWLGLRWKILIAAVATVALLGCVPIILAGVALLLQEQFAWSFAASLLTVGIAVSIIAAGIAGYALSTTGESIRILRQSREEFALNMNWFRNILHGDEEE